jgi:hypothetical protein
MDRHARASHQRRTHTEPFWEKRGVSLLAEATAAAVRLDQSVAMASPLVRIGWHARAHLNEASATARLDEIFIEADDLLLLDHDRLDRLVDQETRAALSGLHLLRSVARRSPRQLFTPRRLLATIRLRLRDRSDAAGLPEWLKHRRADPEEIRRALSRALDPSAISELSSLPGLVGAALLLARWHETGAADLLGGIPGRVLAGAWMRRGEGGQGTFLPAIGFVGHAAEYRPSGTEEWVVEFLEAALRSASRGTGWLLALSRAAERLGAGARPRRSSSHLAAVAELVVENAAVSARQVADILGIAPMTARRLIGQLVGARLVKEITGKASFKLYAAV